MPTSLFISPDLIPLLPGTHESHLSPATYRQNVSPPTRTFLEIASLEDLHCSSGNTCIPGHWPEAREYRSIEAPIRTQCVKWADSFFSLLSSFWKEQISLMRQPCCLWVWWDHSPLSIWTLWRRDKSCTVRNRTRVKGHSQRRPLERWILKIYIQISIVTAEKQTEQLMNEYNNPSFATMFQRTLLNTCITTFFFFFLVLNPIFICKL
jgi:hypothetical protein